MQTVIAQCSAAAQCARAARGEPLALPKGAPLVCPDCGSALVVISPRGASPWLVVAVGVVMLALVGGVAYGVLRREDSATAVAAADSTSPTEIALPPQTDSLALADTLLTPSSRPTVRLAGAAGAEDEPPVASKPVADETPDPEPAIASEVPAPAEPRPLLAAGTRLSATLTQRTCVAKLTRGDPVAATLAEEVANADGGRVPTGTVIVFRVTGRTMSGSDVTAVRLAAVHLVDENRTVALRSDEAVVTLEVSRPDAGKRAATKVAGGALIGAAAGALVKGGKGAAIGAAAGAAVGAAVAATGGEERCVTEGTRVVATLTAPAIP